MDHELYRLETLARTAARSVAWGGGEPACLASRKADADLDAYCAENGVKRWPTIVTS